MEDSYSGSHCKIVHCDGARASLDAALQRIPADQHDSKRRSLQHQVERLANGQRLSAENFVPEGELPNGKRFQALKKIPIRAYLWRQGDVWYISHYVYKDQEKLSRRDVDLVRRNWKEVNAQ